jgi:hypothetical protein
MDVGRIAMVSLCIILMLAKAIVILEIRHPTNWAAVLMQEPLFHALAVKDVPTISMIRLAHHIMDLERRQVNGALVARHAVTGR